MANRILTCRRGGLFSNVNCLISWLHQEPESLFKPIWLPPECLYGTAADGNIWCRLFEPLDAFEHGVVTAEWPHYRFTGIDVAKLYREGEHWRRELSHAAKRIKVLPSILAEAEPYITRLRGKHAVGVHVRSLAHSREIPGGRPALELFLNEATSAGSGPIFLATEQLETVDFFRQRLGDRLIVRDVSRSYDGWDPKSEYHDSRQCSVRDAIDVIVDMLILASGVDCFIHSVSNVATAVLYTNPNLKHVFVINDVTIGGRPSPLYKSSSTVVKRVNADTFRYVRPGDPALKSWSHIEAAFPSAIYLFNAIREHRSQVQMNPTDAIIVSRLAELCMAAGNYFEALDYYESLRQLRPDDILIRRTFADVCAICERLPDALEEYKQLLKLQPRDLSLVLALSAVLGHAGQTSQALSLLQAYIGEAADRVELLEAYAQQLCEAGEPERAIVVVKHATRISGCTPGIWNVFGIAQLCTSDAKGAEKAFSKALDLDPRSVNSHLNLATAYKAMDRLAEAITTYDYAVALHRDQPSCWQPAFDRELAQLSLISENWKASRQTRSDQDCLALSDEPPLTVMIVCYGSFPEYSVRALESIAAGQNLKRFCVCHVGLNECCQPTTQRARDLRDVGIIDLLIESPRNLNKDPMMRLLLDSVKTPYILWIDDDNFFSSERWPELFSAFVQAEHPFDVAGRQARWGPARDRDAGYMEFIRRRPWWKSIDSQVPKLKHWIPFAPGGVFLARTEFLRKHDFPDRGMVKAMDDVALGELIQQVGGRLAVLPPDLLQIADSDGPRRGEGMTLSDEVMR